MQERLLDHLLATLPSIPMIEKKRREGSSENN